jgi:phosphatidylserine/phosphatidylglycerophosphate/cardiolipin synthase-like enzyme
MTQSDIAFPLEAEAHVPPALTGSYPVRSGNLVRPLIDGVPTFQRIGEAIEAARHSVWLTVAFFAPDFAFPDGAGSLLDVLDRTVARGLDVRILFWRPNPESSGYGHTSPVGTEPMPPSCSTKRVGSSMPAIQQKRCSSEASI